MSTKFQKFIARQELLKRQIQATEKEEADIRRKSTKELEEILAEPDEDKS